jgi:hypothetical protein
MVKSVKVMFFTKHRIERTSLDNINSDRASLPTNLRIEFKFEKEDYRADIPVENIKTIWHKISEKDPDTELRMAKLLIRVKTPAIFLQSNYGNDKKRFSRFMSPFRFEEMDKKNADINQLL